MVWIDPAIAVGIGESFDTVVVPHLDAAYRLARWLMRINTMRKMWCRRPPYEPFDTSEHLSAAMGVPGSSELFATPAMAGAVTATRALTDSFDEEQHSGTRPQSDPETLVLQTDDAASIARALSSLPDHFHQLLVLRELEGLSYRELSDVIGIPIGTVMSRLSRAREALRSALDTDLPQPGISSRPHSREQELDAVLV
jgi:RNA polymerase sigma-70 factor (ECF subfamily)